MGVRSSLRSVAEGPGHVARERAAARASGARALRSSARRRRERAPRQAVLHRRRRLRRRGAEALALRARRPGRGPLRSSLRCGARAPRPERPRASAAGSRREAAKKRSLAALLAELLLHWRARRQRTFATEAVQANDFCHFPGDVTNATARAHEGPVRPGPRPSRNRLYEPRASRVLDRLRAGARRL